MQLATNWPHLSVQITLINEKHTNRTGSDPASSNSLGSGSPILGLSCGIPCTKTLHSKFFFSALFDFSLSSFCLLICILYAMCVTPRTKGPGGWGRGGGGGGRGGEGMGGEGGECQAFILHDHQALFLYQHRSLISGPGVLTPFQPPSGHPGIPSKTPWWEGGGREGEGKGGGIFSPSQGYLWARPRGTLRHGCGSASL